MKKTSRGHDGKMASGHAQRGMRAGKLVVLRRGLLAKRRAAWDAPISLALGEEGEKGKRQFRADLVSKVARGGMMESAWSVGGSNIDTVPVHDS